MWSDGTLMCSYHGWRFKQDGACTSIPQVPARFPGAGTPARLLPAWQAVLPPVLYCCMHASAACFLASALPACPNSNQ